MRADGFKAWLSAQGQAQSSVSTRVSDARRVETHYGDLDDAFGQDGLEAIMATLAYGAADRAAGRPNPSRLPIDGDLYDSLASYRAALKAYGLFAGEGPGDPSQADRIRRFALDTVVVPARQRGDAEVELVSGEIHRAMGLENAMPAVCSALGGDRFGRLANVRIVDRQGPANGATVRLRYALDAPAAADWAETELRRRYGIPIVDTVKMLGFALTDARQLALQRDGRAVQLWMEDDPARPSLPADQVRHYLADQARHSNLPPRLRHLPPGGIQARRVSLVTLPDLPALRVVLDWYEAGEGGLDRAALERYRALFVARYPDFEDFGQTNGGYLEEERAYKDRLIAAAAEAVRDLEGEELGGRLLDILAGRAGMQSGLLGWRTDGRLAQLRTERPGVLERAAAALAGVGGTDAAVAAFVHEVWPVLAEGQTSKPYSESRNLPTMLAALVRPDVAYGINTDPVQQTAQALLGRKLLGWNAMTPDEYASVLALVGEIRRTMRDDWGWAPRDL